MNRIIVLRVVRRVTPLGHVAVGDMTAIDVWREICGGHPEEIQSVSFRLPGRSIITLRSLIGFRRYGGISNADLRRWIINSNYDAPGTDLVFEINYSEEDRSIEYTFLGKLDRRV
jgi:hypothetical protein